MNWQEVCEHPSLQDLPFKIELNQWGQVMMSPTTTYRSLLLTENFCQTQSIAIYWSGVATLPNSNVERQCLCSRCVMDV